MTPDERAERIDNELVGGPGWRVTMRAAIAQAIREAVEEERENCSWIDTCRLAEERVEKLEAALREIGSGARLSPAWCPDSPVPGVLCATCYARKALKEE